MSQEQEGQVLELFRESGIPRYLWFTSFGYYRLYGNTRYMWAGLFAVISSVCFLLGFLGLIGVVTGNKTATQTIYLYQVFGIGMSSFVLKSLFLGDYKLAAKIAFPMLILGYILT